MVGLWVGVLAAQSFVANASDRTGKPTWWIDDAGPLLTWLAFLLGFIGPVAVLLIRFWEPRFVVVTQFVAVALLALNAVIDTSRAPGAATVEFLIALAAILGSISALAGLPLNHVQSADVAPEG